MKSIQMTQQFNAPQQVIFDFLSEHNNLGPILGADIKRIKDADGSNPNGLGSVRSIKLGIEVLQETVVTFDAPNVIEYKITSNAPIKYHLGRLEFTTPEAGKTFLNYTIEMESKFSFLDGILMLFLETTIKRGLKKLAEKYK